MPKHQARALIAVIAVLTAVPVALIASATSGPSSATAAVGATGPTGPTAPVVVTGAASSVGQSSAVLNGTVNPEGRSTHFFFQYGPTTAYGVQTSPASAGSGTGNVSVHSNVTGLIPGTTYHYRLVAQNAGGTTQGADQTVTAGLTSQVRFLGREGFVSPGRTIGVLAGCFAGQTRCTGQVTLSHGGTVIGQRNFDIAPDSGGFQNMQISRQGQAMMRSYNRTFHLLPVTVTVTTTSGQKTSQTIHLARWVWR